MLYVVSWLLLSPLAKNYPERQTLKKQHTTHNPQHTTHNTQGEKHMLTKENLKDIYPLTNMQKGMLFHALYDKSSLAYFMQYGVRILEELDIRAYEESWNELLRRYDSLRTVFIHKNVPEPLAAVLKTASPGFYFEDIRVKGITEKSEQENYVKAYKEKDRERGFDLSDDILMRVSVLQLDTDCFESILSFHHILMDGWSLEIVLEEISRCYEALKVGKKPDLPRVPDYKQYIRYTHGLDPEKSKSYWENYLKDCEQPTIVGRPSRSQAGDPSRSQAGAWEREYVPEKLMVELGAQITSRLSRFAAEQRVTVNTVFQTLWGILLSKYSASDHPVFGAVVSGRPEEIEGIERMVGLLINTVPVKIPLSNGEMRFCDLLQNIQEDALGAKPHHYSSLADIQAASFLKDQLFDHVVAFENFPFDEDLSENTKSYRGMRIGGAESFQHTGYDFEMTVMPGERLRFEMRWNGNRYDRQYIKRIEGHFRTVLNAVLEDADIKIRDIEILTDAERDEILKRFNDTAFPYPSDKAFAELFEACVSETPDYPAVIFQDQQLSFRELNRIANRLAHYLRRRHHIRRDQFVGILLDRSEWMIIAIAGILKAGGAYVPMEPDSPVSRTKHMLDDTETPVIITSRKSVGDALSLSESGRDFLFIEELPEILAQESDENPEIVNGPRDLIYVMYTSGSTGQPKGVMVEHRGVIRLVKNTNHTDVGPSHRMLQAANYAFDGSTYEIFGALLNSGTLYMIPKELLWSPEYLCRFVAENQITATFFTTSMFNKLVDTVPEIVTYFDKLHFGGEEGSLKHLRKALKYRKKRDSLVNGYGPTEGTTFCAYYVVDEIKDNMASLPVGYPLGNTSVYILDKYLHPLPVGAEGEIWAGGHGISRGYLNNESLTAERFIANPFVKGDRLYKTGDTGSWMPDGCIEFFGRKDEQVKIRGFRVEPLEIKTYLQSCPGVMEAFVNVRIAEDGNKELVGYLVGECELRAEDIRSHLSETLPDYMIPAHFVQMERLPLNPVTGKVDRNALPDPGASRMASGASYQPPRNEREQKLVQIWQSVLKVQQIGIDDNFFHLGGHSLRATQVVSRIHKELSVSVPLKDMFASPTIRELSDIIERQALSGFDRIEPVPKTGDYEISHAQKRLWIADQTGGRSAVYNIHITLKMEGNLNKDALCRAFDTIILRHESLRTCFVIENGEPRQKIRDDIGFSMEEINLEGKSGIDERLAEFSQMETSTPFDLSRGPLIRAKLLNAGEGLHYCIFTMHHIISDGWSLDVLLRELFTLYEAYSRGCENPLEPLTIHYKDYAAWQNARLREPGELKDFWHTMLKNPPPSLTVPGDFQRPSVKSFRGDTVFMEIEEEVTRGLNQLAKSCNASLYMVLAGAVFALLHRYTAQEDIIIGTGIAGRNHPDLEDQIGFYVNTLPLRLKITGEDSFTGFLQRVTRTVTDVFDHQSYPFDRLVEELRLGKNRSRFPLFDIVVDLQKSKQTESVLNGLRVSVFENKSVASEFDLAFYFLESGEKIELFLEYAQDMYQNDTVVRLSERLKDILGEIVKNPEINISEIRLHQTEAALEHNEVVTQFNF
jgi:bacitracin synthase 3